MQWKSVIKLFEYESAINWASSLRCLIIFCLLVEQVARCFSGAVFRIVGKNCRWTWVGSENTHCQKVRLFVHNRNKHLLSMESLKEIREFEAPALNLIFCLFHSKS